MIRELGRWRSIEWDDEALEKLFELSGGHPLLARFIASDACEQGLNKHVTTEQMQTLAQQITRTLYKHRQGKYLEESVWKWLRPDEREVLRLIVSNAAANGNELRIERELEDALANLEHFGLLMDTTGGTPVRGSLLSNWIYKYEVTHEA